MSCDNLLSLYSNAVLEKQITTTEEITKRFFKKFDLFRIMAFIIHISL